MTPAKFASGCLSISVGVGIKIFAVINTSIGLGVQELLGSVAVGAFVGGRSGTVDAGSVASLAMFGVLIFIENSVGAQFDAGSVSPIK